MPEAVPTRPHDHANVEGIPPARCAICSPPSLRESGFSIENHCSVPVHLTWRDFSGRTRPYGTLSAGHVTVQPSYVGHRWEVTTDDGSVVARHVVAEDGEHVVACP